MTVQAQIETLKEKYPTALLEQKEFLDETTLTIAKENIVDVLKLLKETSSFGYETLIDLTGVDYLKPEKITQVIYLLQNPKSFERIRLIVYVKRDEKLKTITSLWQGADWYERELYDLFGVEFEDRASTERILMPDDCYGHPLRKDYALTEESVQFKNGVKPKVPSEIIPHVTRIQKS